MKIGDWVYCESLDENFKILGIKDYLLQESDVLWVHERVCKKLDTSECGYCNEQKPDARQQRYSAGIYAGRMCDDCAYSRYRDHCGLDNTPQLTQADCDEAIEPEDYY